MQTEYEPIRAWRTTDKEDNQDARDITETDLKRAQWFEDQHKEKK